MFGNDEQRALDFMGEIGKAFADNSIAVGELQQERDRRLVIIKFGWRGGRGFGLCLQRGWASHHTFRWRRAHHLQDMPWLSTHAEPPPAPLQPNLVGPKQADCSRVDVALGHCCM